MLSCDPLDLDGGGELQPLTVIQCGLLPFRQLYGCVRAPQSLMFGGCIDFSNQMSAGRVRFFSVT